MAIKNELNERVINQRNNETNEMKIQTLIYYRKKTLQSFKCIFLVEIFDSYVLTCVQRLKLRLEQKPPFEIQTTATKNQLEFFRLW